MPDQPPPGLPEEFHKDWEFVTDEENWAMGEDKKGCWRAALERVAQQQNSIWELEEMVSKVESERNERGRTIHTLRSLLQERMEKCECRFKLTNTTSNRGQERDYCDLCRRTLEAQEGKMSEIDIANLQIKIGKLQAECAKLVNELARLRAENERLLIELKERTKGMGPPPLPARRQGRGT